MIDEPTTTASAVQPAAAKKNPAEIGQSSDFFLLIGIMAGVLFLGAVVIWCVDRWRKRQERDDTPSLSLSNFRAMFENGEITQAEYDKILARMAPKIKGATPPAKITKDDSDLAMKQKMAMMQMMNPPLAISPPPPPPPPHFPKSE